MSLNSITLYTLNFRLKQFLRLLYEIGVIRSFILIGICLVLLTALYRFSNDLFYLPIFVYGFIMFIYQSNRKDKAFLKIFIKIPYIVYAVEYACLALPFISISLLYKEFISVVYYILIIALVPLIPSLKAQLPKISCPLFTKGSYEYQLLLRKNLILLVLFIIISALGIYNNNEKILYVFAVFYSLVCCSSIVEPENKYYTRIYLAANKYLKHKMTSCIYNMSLLFIPFFIIGFRHLDVILLIYIASLFVAVVLTLFRLIFSESKLLAYIYFTFLICPLILLNIVYPITIAVSVAGLLFLTYTAKNKFNNLLNDQNLFFK